MEVNGDLIKTLGDGHKIGVYDGTSGAKYRIIVPYQDKFYAVFWIQFHRDGSIYCGIRDKQVTKYKSGTASLINGKYSIELNDKIPYIIPERQLKNRFSFHGTGEIHDLEPDHTTWRLPISQINQQNELFKVFFKEISKFESIQQARKTDLCILTNLPSEHMLIMNVYIAPQDKINIVPINGGANNYTAIINFKNLDCIDDFCILLCFGPSIEKGTPDFSILTWPVQNC